MFIHYLWMSHGHCYELSLSSKKTELTDHPSIVFFDLYSYSFYERLTWRKLSTEVTHELRKFDGKRGSPSLNLKSQTSLNPKSQLLWGQSGRTYGQRRGSDTEVCSGSTEDLRWRGRRVPGPGTVTNLGLLRSRPSLRWIRVRVGRKLVETKYGKV